MNKLRLRRSNVEKGSINDRASSEARSGSTKKKGPRVGISLTVVGRLCGVPIRQISMTGMYKHNRRMNALRASI